LPVWDLFIHASSTGVNSDGFRFDLVDITRQVLANYALPLQKKWVDAFKTKDTFGLKNTAGSSCNLSVIWMRCLQRVKIFSSAMDRLMRAVVAELKMKKVLYERNARNLIHSWGDANSPIA
jgi:alpha-N-acetylglucosaminidase